MPYNRRSFFRTVSASVAAALPAMPQNPRFRKPLGVQIYTVRAQLPQAADRTLKQIREIGYTEVEAVRGDLATLAPILKRYDLAVPSVHVETGLVTGNSREWNLPAGLTWEGAIDQANSSGVRFVVIPYVQRSERRTPDEWRTFCEKLNRAGETARRAGVSLCYHNHAYEFAGQPGERPIDALVDHTDPALVGLEPDVFWIGAAGADPVEFLNRHGARIRLLHLKDKPKDMPAIFDESKAKQSDFKEIGNGSLDFPAILRAADKAGVAHYFVEQDYTPGDPVDSLRVSYQRLRALTI